jgi:hypothetical protein
VPQSQTVHQDVYKGVLQLSRDSIRRRNPETWATCTVRGSSYRTVRGRIRRYQSKNLSVGFKLLYCCVRQVCHREIIVFTFPRLQRALKGHSYSDIQAIQTAAILELCSIPGSDFQDCFTDLQKRRRRCVDAGGSYFERDP